jgi:hypothetical protein
MGRYYNGDIEGKFWFGLQSSTAASRFGVEPAEPSYVNYYFDEEGNLEDIQKELKNIEDKIGKDNLGKIEILWSKIDSYNDEILKEHGMFDIWKEHGEDYVDYLLGKKIEKCVVENGDCSFDADL